jgi:hypothetical protein
VSGALGSLLSQGAAALGSGTGATLATGVGGALIDVLLRTPRMIGLIIPDVAIEEQHSDEVLVTEFPVERGAAISDHAYKRPPTLTMRVGWSNSVSLSALATTLISGGATDILPIINPAATGLGNLVTDRVKLIYAQLLALQENLDQPFTITTGKRQYINMVMTHLSVQTDNKSEYALMATIQFRHVIMVDTKITAIPAQSQQANPQATADPVNGGTVQPLSGGSVLQNNPSALSNVLAGLIPGYTPLPGTSPP